jgi:putative SOS response-associated peptidase YedK
MFMCGRFGFTRPEKIARYYQNIVLPPAAEDLRPRYNIAPSQVIPVIINTHELRLMHWGLVPYWAREGADIRPQINARAEGIESKATFRKAFRTQRCLIPASFFYEWKRTPEGKEPYLFKLKREDIFSFAGIYDVWHGKDGKELLSCAIITTEPNSLLTPIHNRMPVILHRDDEEAWLNPDTTEPEHLSPFLKPYPAEEMEAYPVSKSVNSPVNDTPAVIQPVQ